MSNFYLSDPNILTAPLNMQEFKIYNYLCKNYNATKHTAYVRLVDIAGLFQLTTKGYGRGLAELLEGKEQVDPKMWRTPDAHCNRGPSSVKRMKMKLEKGMPISINDQVAHPDLMWPTPRASTAMSENVENIKKRDKDNSRLEERVAKLWSTPVQDDVHHRKQKYSQGGTALSTQAGGSLNPNWVEWLMGYKAGYTDLSHWEILSSRKSSKRSATPSSKLKKKKT